MNERLYLSISEAATSFRNGVLTPRQLTDDLLDAIDGLNPWLNAYLNVSADLAREQADAATSALQNGGDDSAGRLLGIPIGLKDLYDVAGSPTTAGSPIPSRKPVASDCPVAAHLRAAGAVFLGKHHMHEWALGVTTNNAHFGPCLNPWDPTRSPGGSSGGSGAALAAGLCFGTFGSDTGGSIRIPASLCGVVGLKPTTGRVSLRGVVPLSWTLDHAGPLARSVEDAAILLQAVDVYDALDPTSVDGPRVDPTAALREGAKGLRVLVPSNYFFETADPDVGDAVTAALDVFSDLGAQIERVTLPGVDELSGANATITRAEAATYHARDLRERSGQFGPDVLVRMRQGEETSAISYALARRIGVVWRRRFESMLDDRTVIVTPTTPISAPKIEGTDAVAAAGRLTSFTSPFNLTGLPALSIPCGFSGDKLPIGLQIVGRAWNEALVLRAGAAYEEATDWHRQRPPIW